MNNNPACACTDLATETPDVQTSLSRIGLGCNEATRQLWNHYAPRLRAVARRHLAGFDQTMVDDEDIVTCAFYRLVRAAQKGRLKTIVHHDQLWYTLVQMAKQCAIDHFRREHRTKRGSGLRPRSISTLHNEDDLEDDQLGQPDEQIILREETERVIEFTGCPAMRQLVRRKLLGYTNRELANEFGMSLRSIDRQLAKMRRLYRRKRYVG